MPHANAQASAQSPGDRARRAFTDEQLRMRHYRKALACVEDASLRLQWSRELQACRERAARLAIALLELGESMPFAEQRHDATRCLLDAMDMALCNGDMSAAEAVARECMTLVDMRCERELGQPR